MSKPALVLVHGYLGGSGQWAQQVEQLSPLFEIITPDLPGFADNNAAVSPESISGHANWVLNHLSEIGVQQFNLLGHSMGGMIVQQMVAQQPERINQLVLYGTGPVGMMPGRFETIDQSRQRIVREGVEATARQIVATWFVDREHATGYDLCAELACQSSEQAALAALTAMESWSGTEALPSITRQTLVLWGDRDRAYLWPQPERLWRDIPDAQLAVIPGCCHAIHLEKPHLFHAVLKDFLTDAG